jgi:hypothetical protein
MIALSDERLPWNWCLQGDPWPRLLSHPGVKIFSYEPTSLFLLIFSFAITFGLRVRIPPLRSEIIGVFPLISLTGQADHGPAATKPPFPKDGRSSFEVIGRHDSGFLKDLREASLPASHNKDAALHRSGRCHEDGHLAASARARHRVGLPLESNRPPQGTMTAEGGWNAKCTSLNSMALRSATS